MKANNVLQVRRTEKTPLRALRKVILLILTLALLATIPLYLCKIAPISSQSPDKISSAGSTSVPLKVTCNIFRGHWVPYAKGPYYNNSTNCAVDDRQNCLKFGRPDTGFMKWRWKPDQCELPLFDAAQFLELVRGKSMVFVGDSVGRNQVESLMCLLASVATPVNAPIEGGGALKSWLYSNYNFTLGIIWSPSLVQLSVNVKPKGSSLLNLLNLYLDRADEAWAGHVENSDYVIISAGQWFSRPLIYHEKGKIVGCHMCKNDGIPELSRFYGYRRALRMAFKAVLNLPNFNGVTILRTFSPTHFGSEDWVKGGNCSMTKPLGQREMKMDAHNLEFYLTQMDEFRAAEREGSKRGLKFRLLDVTGAMGMRPDGHPYHYGHPPDKEQHIADCLHWCLPGPIDSWNELLLHMLKNEMMKGQESIAATVLL